MSDECHYSSYLVESIADVPKHLWKTAKTPFTQLAFWQALENNQLIGSGSHWQSVYVLVMAEQQINFETNNKEVQSPNLSHAVAMMPVFIKNHHAGEYVFDHAWAHAFYQYGMDYYPRLVTSVPFTPVVGQRIWMAEQVVLSSDMMLVLDEAINRIAKKVDASTWHGLFICDGQVSLWQDTYNLLGNDTNFLERNGCQFLWQNKQFNGSAFSSFDDFLAKLTAKKRKNIRAERKKIIKNSINCVWKLADKQQHNQLYAEQMADISVAEQAITENDWKTFYQCYAMTYAIRGQSPYLSLAFFTEITQSMPKNIAMAQAYDEQDNIIACSLFFYDDTHLYGRYWGCLQEVNFLHFELCYYQGISFAIAKGLEYFDPGTQGEHKLIRGFEPKKTHSLRKVFVPEFVPAIAEYCKQERQENDSYLHSAEQALPFKQLE